MASYGSLRTKAISSHIPLRVRLALVSPFSWEEEEVKHLRRGHSEGESRAQKFDIFFGLGAGLWLILTQYQGLLPPLSEDQGTHSKVNPGTSPITERS